MTLRNIVAFLPHRRARRIAVAAGNVVACAGLVGFIACSDGGITEPVVASSRTAAAPSIAGVQLHASVATDTAYQIFVYNPATGGTITFPNGAKVVVPAAAVCNPTASGYGPGIWDRPCTATTTPTTFSIRAWIGSAGNAQAVVSPDVRFVPGKIASLYLPAPTNDPTAKPVIQWCTAKMTNCVDEGAADPALATHYDAKPAIAQRRIKHFSGYNVSWSRSSQGSNPASNTQ